MEAALEFEKNDDVEFHRCGRKAVWIVHVDLTHNWLSFQKAAYKYSRRALCFSIVSNCSLGKNEDNILF